MEEEILGEIQVEIEEEHREIEEDQILGETVQETQDSEETVQETQDSEVIIPEDQIPEDQTQEDIPQTKKEQVHLEEKTGTIGTKETNQKMGFMAGVEILSKEKIDIKSQ